MFLIEKSWVLKGGRRQREIVTDVLIAGLHSFAAPSAVGVVRSQSRLIQRPPQAMTRQNIEFPSLNQYICNQEVWGNETIKNNHR